MKKGRGLSIWPLGKNLHVSHPFYSKHFDPQTSRPGRQNPDLITKGYGGTTTAPPPPMRHADGDKTGWAAQTPHPFQQPTQPAVPQGVHPTSSLWPPHSGIQPSAGQAQAHPYGQVHPFGPAHPYGPMLPFGHAHPTGHPYPFEPAAHGQQAPVPYPANLYSGGPANYTGQQCAPAPGATSWSHAPNPPMTPSQQPASHLYPPLTFQSHLPAMVNRQGVAPPPSKETHGPHAVTLGGEKPVIGNATVTPMGVSKESAHPMSKPLAPDSMTQNGSSLGLDLKTSPGPAHKLSNESVPGIQVDAQPGGEWTQAQVIPDSTDLTISKPTNFLGPDTPKVSSCLTSPEVNHNSRPGVSSSSSSSSSQDEPIAWNLSDLKMGSPKGPAQSADRDALTIPWSQLVESTASFAKSFAQAGRPTGEILNLQTDQPDTC